MTFANVLVMVATGGLIESLKKLFPDSKFLYRARRLLPITITSVLIHVPGVSDHPVGVRVLLGIVLGMFTMTVYDIVVKEFLRRRKASTFAEREVSRKLEQQSSEPEGLEEA